MRLPWTLPLLSRGAEPLLVVLVLVAVAMTVRFGPRVRDNLLGQPSPDARLVTAAGDDEPADFEQALADGGSAGWRDAQGVTALMMAASTGHAGRVERLIAVGADVNAADTGGETPLMFAAMSNHTGVVELLLRHGADPGRGDRIGETALDRARRYRADDVVARLSAARNRAD